MEETRSSEVDVAKQIDDDEHVEHECPTAVRSVVGVVPHRYDFEQDDACNNVCVMFDLVAGRFCVKRVLNMAVISRVAMLFCKSSLFDVNCCMITEITVISSNLVRTNIESQ